MKNIYRVFCFLLFAQVIFSQIPKTISYQGILTDTTGNHKPDGDYSFTFSFYESNSRGNALWSESKTLIVANGLFSTLLGDQTPFSPNIKFDKPYWLGIKIGNDPELIPRVSLSTAGYSFSSIYSDTAKNIINGKVIKSLNGLKDNIRLIGNGETSVNVSGDSIIISSSSSSGGGIQGVQNTDGKIIITNPNGPTPTINLKVPLSLNGNVSAGSSVFSVKVTSGNGWGVWGYSPSGTGVYGQSDTWTGVYGLSNSGRAVWGASTTGEGLYGTSTDQTGAYGKSTNGSGVYGISTNQFGVNAYSEHSHGIHAESNGDYGIVGITHAAQRAGVYGADSPSPTAYGMLGFSLNNYHIGVYGKSSTLAGLFEGNINVTGTLYGGGNVKLKIDDPLDPANKYLVHSSVASPDQMNIYNGNVTTDLNSSATIVLPSYFETLNIDYRYQLTTIGQQAQAWVESEIHNNQFTIKTDKPNVKISWQVTGVRNDPYAKAHPMVVEEEKRNADRGKYLHPELYGQPKENAILYIKKPEMNQQQNIEK